MTGSNANAGCWCSVAAWNKYWMFSSIYLCGCHTAFIHMAVLLTSLGYYHYVWVCVICVSTVQHNVSTVLRYEYAYSHFFILSDCIQQTLTLWTLRSRCILWSNIWSENTLNPHDITVLLSDACTIDPGHVFYFF